MEKYYTTKAFLIFLLVSIVTACFFVFKPFLVEILAAAILVSIFFTPYEWLSRKIGGRRKIAALLMCLLVALLVIIPMANFIVYAAQKSVDTYDDIVKFASGGGNVRDIIDEKSGFLKKTYYYVAENERVQKVVIDVAKKMNNWLVSGATDLVKGATGFFLSLIITIFVMFFFFIDGEEMLRKIMRWTPLPNKYDKELFDKFRAVSYSTMIATLVTAVAQGIVGGVGLAIVGVPAFFAGIAIAFFSLIPYMGAALIWLPVAVYLLIVGDVWQGVFLIIWGAAVVGVIDNVIRAYLIKGKAQVHPMFVVFSILGGISLFGFWGIVFGPLIISLAVTVLHIYEMEYRNVLEE